MQIKTSVKYNYTTPRTAAIKKIIPKPWLGGSVGWSIVPYTKSCGFDSQSGNIPRSWVQSPVGECSRGNSSMFLSLINVSLPLSLKKINKYTLG